MGAWGTDIFDNDNAADFSGSVEGCSDVQARHDLLRATMGAVLERDIREDEMTPEYEFGYEVEYALASAAYVADAKNGRHDFTDCSYAMGLHRDMDFEDDAAWYHIDIGTPPAELVQMAVELVQKVLERMQAVHLDQEWVDPSERLLAALKETPERG